MIGFYGIVCSENRINRNAREEAFMKMSDSIWKDDFYNESISRKNYTIGITRRNIGENKDLCLKAINDDFIIAFNGYGKFKGEKKLYWASDMAERIVQPFLKNGINRLLEIEGAFACLVFYKNELIILGDRFSSKCLYYYESDRLLIFSPDVGRILYTNIIPKEKNIEAASQVLLSSFFLDDNTLVKDIRHLPYATVLSKKIDHPSKSTKIRYWEMPKNEGDIGSINPELIEHFGENIKQAIYECADLEERSLVPLSGGLDSRTIACFLSEKQKLKALTYDLGIEVNLSKKVCKVLNGEHLFFSNDMVSSDYFRNTLNKLIYDQKIHAIINQYFQTPSFKLHFVQNRKDAALYDGIYLDILFSAPYTFMKFDFNEFFRIYGGSSIPLISKWSYSLDEGRLMEIMKKQFATILEGFEKSDGVGKSQLFYVMGRLRRYVAESSGSRENYCYVFRPGFNYELMDFGYRLGLSLRKGQLYKQMLYSRFSEVMKIPYKDSYHNRQKRLHERMKENYVSFRLNLSLLTRGMFIYTDHQIEYYFFKKKRLSDFRDIFSCKNHISELFTDLQLENLFNSVKNKQYLLGLFQRVLFLQQFYRRHNFK